MRRYETIYILRPTLSEDEVTATIEMANDVLSTDDGQVIALDRWGVRKLAYLIKKETQGYYVFCDYATAPDNVLEMERKFRIDDAVMKYLTVKVADTIDSEGIETARGAYEAAKVAAAEAEEEAEQAEEKPAAAKTEEKPAKTKAEEKPAETKAEEKPVDAKETVEEDEK
ncbi:MAG: 30S ribosomal protein S6 [Thermodesulfobacteriota bacterium]